MSCENLEQLNIHVEAKDETQKSCKISYTREFLLSLSQLDVCQKLPSGFDQSILSEFEDVPQDRFRIPGGLSSHSYRRNDYSSSPPTRGDGNNYSRGNHGRWDSRSSGRSDRDSDSLSDLDSDSGKRGNQFRHSWQVPEHDGLLGSGSFPRPPGFATGTSGPKSRTSDPYQLNRSNEPYHPPRPYKAVPHLRRDTHDSYNDETFGSFENTSEDRAEEERKRRASFELMRKEQHKAFQEKQKNPEKSKDNFDFSELLEDPKDDKRFLNRRNESDEPVIQPTPINDSDKSSFPSAANVSRPLVPPGFSSPIAEKNNKPLIHPQPLEIGNELDGGLFHAKGSRLFGGDANKQEGKQSFEEIDSRAQLSGGLGIRNSVNNKSEKTQNFPLAVDISKKAVDKDDHSKALEPLDATQSNQFMGHNANDVLGSGVGGESTTTHSTSILDQLFGSALTLNGVDPSSTIEKDNIQADDAWTPHTVQSSKFAQWFHEEEKPLHVSSGRPDKLVEDFSSDRPDELVDVPSFSKTTKSVEDRSSERSNDLLSLIVGGEKSGSLGFGGEKSIPFIVGGESNRLSVEDTKKSNSQVFNAPPSFPLQLAEIADGHVAPKSTDKIEAVPAVLTCEDLEQSILSKITDNPSVLPPPVESWNGLVAETEQKKVDTDSNASQHLLSLLKKAEPSGNSGILPSARSHDIEKENLGTMFFGSSETENHPSAGKPLTLETLFGSAFMKELKSAGAPTSSQERPGSSFPMGNLFSLTADNASNIPSGNGVLASNQRAPVTPETIGEQILGFNIQSEVDPSELQTGFGSKLGGFDGSAGVRLQEEDTLVAANDPLNLHNFITGRNLARADPLLRPEKALDDAHKLAALHSGYPDERTIMGLQEGQSIFPGPYDTRGADVQYHKLHGQASSLNLHPSQLNHMVQRSHSLDSHPPNNNAQMKFIDPNHQFPANLHRPPFHHPTMGGLEPNPHNHPMMQQMHMPGNFPPHLARGFPRGAPLSPHPNNQVAGFMQEPNLMQGFPFGQKQPNFGGPGIPPQGGDVGSGAPHIQSMEQRSNSKQMHPFPNHGIYGPELDLGFGFR